MLTHTFKLTLDRPVVISGDTIAPGADLFDHPTFRSGIEIIKEKSNYNGIGYTMPFTHTLMQQMVFETGVYQVQFSCRTNDGKNLSKGRQVIFKQ
jgi:hypothetical protein